jgi:glycosyltransferase involved in cell wall biosynthesis
MTAFVSTNAGKDPSSAESRTVSTCKLHLIQIEDVEPVNKGIYAVLPAFNEELVIGSVVLRTKQYVDQVIVVDDGSSDRTAEVAKLAGAEVIRLDFNTGKAYALLLGLRHARERGCTVAVMLDADGQHDPSEIQRLAGLVSIGKADLVIGSRFLYKNRGIPPYRQFGQKTLDLFTNIGSKARVTDSQSGFRALSCQALDNLDFRSDGYNVESDMIAHFSALGLPIAEVPITVKYDVPNKHKKHPLTHGLGVLSRLIDLITRRRPLLMFGLPGACFVIIGLMFASQAFNEYYLTSKFSFSTSMTSVLLLVIGMFMGIAGLLLNTLVSIINEQKENKPGLVQTKIV